MPQPRDAARDHDIVLFGATGFTGGLTADYLARNAPADCRWALAGRSREKLEAVRDRLAEIDPKHAQLPLLIADIGDEDSVRAVADSARVVITTVGPYLQYGEPLVAACAAAGTDYVDLTGEPEFVDLMYLHHHGTAIESGARIVHACGFDSIPYDLGALFTVKQLPPNVPIKLTGIIRAGGGPSGGTFHSAINQFSRSRTMRSVSAERRKREGRPLGRKARSVAGKPHRDKTTGYWLAPLPTIDPIIVARSARELDDYGPDFTYSHYAGMKHVATIAVAGVGLGALIGAAQVPPLRKLLLSRVPQGAGPSEEKRAKGWFTMRFIAEAGGQTLRTQVSGGDPGYTETAKMLSEAALSLAYDDNPKVAGQTTTAVAMGQNLIGRLIKAGMRFEVTEGL